MASNQVEVRDVARAPLLCLPVYTTMAPSDPSVAKALEHIQRLAPKTFPVLFSPQAMQRVTHVVLAATRAGKFLGIATLASVGVEETTVPSLSALWCDRRAWAANIRADRGLLVHLVETSNTVYNRNPDIEDFKQLCHKLQQNQEQYRPKPGTNYSEAGDAFTFVALSSTLERLISDNRRMNPLFTHATEAT
jgi:hypothetical protein